MTLPPFANEPVLELRRAPARQGLLDALAELDTTLPLRSPAWIGDDRDDGEALTSTDPSDPSRVVALAPCGGADAAGAAVTSAQQGFRAWSATGAAERAAVLLRAAEGMRRRRPALAALCVREAGKPWAEADADVCEAIDFLEFYARGALALERGRPLFQVTGERNTLSYGPRGVVAVIAPWNFPVAIPTGMVAAALATGNTVVLKPAEQAPGCGFALTAVLREAGVPPDALALVQGQGEAGAALVADPRVATIAFTGSGAVGLEILRSAAQLAPGQTQLKRCVIEMGGKNCIIVDGDADLDDAVPAIVRSAFDYAGQKCSAASRILVHEAIADALIERLAGAVEVLQVGAPGAFGSDVGPVIEREAARRVRRYTAQAAAAGRVVASRDELPAAGWYCPPTVVADVAPGTPVLSEEVFGPLLTVERVGSVDEACDRVDALPFALTGGLFSRNPDTVAHVARRSPVGNLYVNRKITAAMVGRQPFGGNRLSGTGTKAGGPDYLMSFVEPRVVTENTVRHGLVV
ncbi:aldehyde dehydrogenase family protein [Baekduia soli]|uniref:aldehyde dehydrogenase family protein n=1 Tax=Baekduia soli TaxID=496014 RepID=UPI001651C864|nr:aldehyde dehydrogenase family protein [Baekduia soli]